MPDTPSDAIGLVLSGAVAQGAFEAGFLGKLAGTSPDIRSIAGTSSGALNAAVMAAGVATGQLAKAASVLKRLWTDDGSWQHIADVPWSDWWHWRGAFDTRRLEELVRQGLDEVFDGWNGELLPVELTLVTTDLDAQVPRDPSRAAVPLPIYEAPIVFREDQLRDPDQRERVANAAAASATFPGLFSPTAFDGTPRVDGGAVNNAPIKYVIGDAQVGTVIVVTTEPSVVPQEANLGGVALVGRLAAALINERIAYDLGQARRANLRFRDVVAALDEAGVAQQARERVLSALGYRSLDLFLVQPDTALPGDAFSGFLHRDQREAYVAAGERATPTPIR